MRCSIVYKTLIYLLCDSLICCSQPINEPTDNVVAFSVLGDSISTLRGYQPNHFPAFYPSNYKIHYSETWWGQLESKLGWSFLSNASWSASTVSGNGDSSCFYSDERLKAIFDADVPDYLLIMGGINDWIHSVPLINATDTLDSHSFSGAYRLLLNKALSYAPGITIVCCSILPTREGCDVKNQSDWTIREGNDVLKRICKEYNIVFIDFSGIWNGQEDRLLIDRIHPNEYGMSAISDAIVRGLGMSRHF